MFQNFNLVVKMVSKIQSVPFLLVYGRISRIFQGLFLYIVKYICLNIGSDRPSFHMRQSVCLSVFPSEFTIIFLTVPGFRACFFHLVSGCVQHSWGSCIIQWAVKKLKLFICMLQHYQHLWQHFRLKVSLKYQFFFL